MGSISQKRNPLHRLKARTPKSYGVPVGGSKEADFSFGIRADEANYDDGAFFPLETAVSCAPDVVRAVAVKQTKKKTKDV